MFSLSDIPGPVLRHVVGLWRRRWYAVTAAWAVAIICWAGVYMMPDRYESRAQVYVNTDSILDPIMKNLAPRPDPGKRVGIMRLRLLARPNVEQTIYDSGLDARAQTPAAMERLVAELTANIHVDSPRDGFFIISYKSTDPQIAQKVVASVLNIFIENDLGASLTDIDFARTYLDKQVSEYEARLTSKEKERAEFERQHAGELAGGERNMRRIDQKEQELSRLNEDLAARKRTLNALRATLAQTPSAGTSSELDEMKQKLAEMRTIYQDSYPDVRLLKERIANLEKSSGEATNPEYRRLQNEIRQTGAEIAAIQDRVTTVQKEIESLNATVQQVPEVQAELQRIVRDYEQTRDIYNELVFKRNQLSLTASLGDGGDSIEYKIFEEPKTPVEPSGPPRGLLTLAGLVIGLGAGVGLSALFTLLDRTFLQQSDLQSRLGLPVLGAVSVAPSVWRKRNPLFEKGALAAACCALFAAAGAMYYVYELRSADAPADVTAASTPVASSSAAKG